MVLILTSTFVYLKEGVHWCELSRNNALFRTLYYPFSFVLAFLLFIDALCSTIIHTLGGCQNAMVNRWMYGVWVVKVVANSSRPEIFSDETFTRRVWNSKALPAVSLITQSRPEPNSRLADKNSCVGVLRPGKNVTSLSCGA